MDFLKPSQVEINRDSIATSTDDSASYYSTDEQHDGSYLTACVDQIGELVDYPCKDFFQQKGSIDYKAYLKLKQEERQAVVQYNAAVIIQAAWRGFLIRSNMKIVEAAIIKIQSGVRAYLARKRVKTLLEERAQRILDEILTKAAIMIQAWWRGYLSRKSKFDFQRYKSLQIKNAALQRSIDRINELEAALLRTLESRDSQGTMTRSITSISESKSSSGKGTASQKARLTETGQRITMVTSSMDPCVGYYGPEEDEDTGMIEEESLPFEFENMTPSIENMLIDKLPEMMGEMSETRISELYAYLANLETDMKAEEALIRQVEKLGGIRNLNPEQTYRLDQAKRRQRERANRILDLAKLGMMGPLKRKFVLRERDSVDEMFPNIPDRPDVVKPDGRKVHALKDAIRLFRQKGHAMEEWELRKNHFLLRTKQTPGVLSDIYTTELTEIEKRIKAVKFWKGSMAAERMRKRQESAVAAKNRRLRRLFAHALKLTRPGDNGTADDEAEEEEEVRSMSYDENCEEDDSDSSASEWSRSKKGCPGKFQMKPYAPPPSPTATDSSKSEKTTNGFVSEEEE